MIRYYDSLINRAKGPEGPEAPLATLSKRQDLACYRHYARSICAFFGLDVPAWARKRLGPGMKRRGLYGLSAKEYAHAYYLAVTKPKRMAKKEARQ